MQSEEPTIIQSLENHLAEYGHTTVGQDIAAAILVIKDLHQKAALSAAEPQPAPSVAVKALPELCPCGDIMRGGHCQCGNFSTAQSHLPSAEQERLRFEGDLDKWMKIIGAGITGYQPEAYAAMDAACRELVKLRSLSAAEPQFATTAAVSQTLVDLATAVIAQAPATATEFMGISLDDIRSALSAQVQDVAGWQPIETAPKDGTPVILWTVWVGDEISPDPFSEVQIGYWDHGNDLPESNDFSRRPEWVVQRIGEPTHWMPIPAAPAKQEGGE